MTFGRLIASGDARVTLNGVPVEVPALVQILVPGWRWMPDRPGSMMNVMVEGAMPLATFATRAEPVPGTLNVRRPLPRLFTLTAAEAIPRWQSSMARNTCVTSG